MTDKLNILEVAKAQKFVLWCVLLNLVAFFIQQVFFVALPLTAYAMYRLASALKERGAIAVALCSLLPIVNLVLLFNRNSKATKMLKEAGIRVRIMGADLREVRAITLPHVSPAAPASHLQE